MRRLRRQKSPLRKAREEILRRARAEMQGRPVRGLSGPARAGRHRRRRDRDTRPPARADRDRSLPGRQGRLPRKAADADHIRGTATAQGRARTLPDTAGGKPAAVRCRIHPCGQPGPRRRAGAHRADQGARGRLPHPLYPAPTGSSRRAELGQMARPAARNDILQFGPEPGHHARAGAERAALGRMALVQRHGAA